MVADSTPSGGLVRRGRLIVIAAASGTGKTSLVKALMAARPALRFSVSYTTRAPRASEINGRCRDAECKPNGQSRYAIAQIKIGKQNLSDASGRR